MRTRATAFIALTLLMGGAYAKPYPTSQRHLEQRTTAIEKSQKSHPHSASSNEGGRALEAQKAVEEGYRYLRKRNYARSLRRFGEAVILDPDNGNAYHGIALTYLRGKKDVKAADVYFNLAISRRMVSSEVYIDYAKFLASQGRFDASLESLYKTLDRWPRASDARSNIAMIYYQKKNYAKACEWAKSAFRNKDNLQQTFLDSACSQY